MKVLDTPVVATILTVYLLVVTEPLGALTVMSPVTKELANKKSQLFNLYVY
jgi:small neutral amino acid transporter SnatA (MarC family)